MVKKRLSPKSKMAMVKTSKHLSLRDTAAAFGVAPATVLRRRRSTLSPSPLQPKKQVGRPPTFTAQYVRRIERSLRQNRKLTPTQMVSLLKSEGIDISESTLRRIMKQLGYFRAKARPKPFLSEKACQQRLGYAKEHAGDSMNDWRRTIFVDEAAFRSNGDVDTWVTRKQGEEWLIECLVAKLQSGKQSVMVWGAIWHGGRSQLVCFDTRSSEGKKGGVTAVIYSTQITQGELRIAWQRLNSVWKGFGGARLVEDGARIHTSVTNRSVGLKQHFQYLEHPPYSPDLNPIENVWAMVKKEIAKLPRRPQTADTLFQEAQLAWNGLEQGKIDACVDSMRTQILSVKDHKGGSTKY